MLSKIIISASALPLLLLVSAPAQQLGNPSGIDRGSQQFRAGNIPLPILYKHFFAHIRQLDTEADQLAQNSNDGTKYRRYYQNRLKFSDEQFSYVRDAAGNTQEIEKLDERAKAIIMEFRKELANRPQATEANLPPVPRELRELKMQRDQLLSSAIADLKGKLGPQVSADLDALVKSDFGAHSSVQPIIALHQQQSKPRNLNLPVLDSKPYQP